MISAVLLLLGWLIVGFLGLLWIGLNVSLVGEVLCIFPYVLVAMLLGFNVGWQAADR